MLTFVIYHRFSCLALLLPCLSEITFVINEPAFIFDKIAKLSYEARILFELWMRLLNVQIPCLQLQSNCFEFQSSCSHFQSNCFRFSLRYLYYEVNQLSDRPNKVLCCIPLEGCLPQKSNSNDNKINKSNNINSEKHNNISSIRNSNDGNESRVSWLRLILVVVVVAVDVASSVVNFGTVELIILMSVEGRLTEFS